jgi:hypothetical protein
VTINIKRFPRSTLRAGRPLWRIHLAEHGAWWFSFDGRNRFDPVAAPGLGACYLASEPLAAFVEVFRTTLELAESDIESRRLSRVDFPRDLSLADMCSRRLREFGLTAAVGASGDYDTPQSLASELAAAGYDGVRYHVRHDPSQNLLGVALFGTAGASAVGLPKPLSREIDEDLLDEARRKFRYRVLP